MLSSAGNINSGSLGCDPTAAGLAAIDGGGPLGL